MFQDVVKNVQIGSFCLLVPTMYIQNSCSKQYKFVKAYAIPANYSVPNKV